MERIPRFMSRSNPRIWGLVVSFVNVEIGKASEVGMGTTELSFMSLIRLEVTLR